MQMEASVQVHKVRSEDAMLGSHDVLALFSQVSGVKQDESCLYLAPLEQMDFRVPQVSKGPKVLLSSTSPGGGIRTFSGFSHADHWSCPQQVTEVSLEPQEGLAFQERRVLSARRELDFQGLQAPKVSLQDEPNHEWDHSSDSVHPLAGQHQGLCSLRSTLLELTRVRGNGHEDAMRVVTVQIWEGLPMTSQCSDVSH